MKVFKTVQKDENGQYTSIAEVVHSLSYAIGEWTLAETDLANLGYHPLAFRNPEDARFFAGHDTLTAVLECEARFIPAGMPSRYFVADTVFTSPHGSPHLCWPSGTVMCGAIMPVKEICGVKFGYKVVRPTMIYSELGAFMSAVIGAGAGVSYSPDQVSRARPHMADIDFHLCLFDTKENAAYFSKSSHEDEVWKCAYWDEVPSPTMFPSYTYMDSLSKTPNLTPHRYFWPTGSIMAKSVMLIRRENV